MGEAVQLVYSQLSPILLKKTEGVGVHKITKLALI